MKILIICLMILLCTASGLAQSRSKRSSLKPRQSIAFKIPTDLMQQMVRDDKDIQACLELEATTIEKFSSENIKVEQVDLNTDGKPELVLSGETSCLCGMHACVTWVYGKTSKGWKRLLKASGDGGVKLERTSTNGYRDVSTGAGAAMYYYSSVFKFDGTQYKECIVKSYEPNQTGRMILKSVKKKC